MGCISAWTIDGVIVVTMGGVRLTGWETQPLRNAGGFDCCDGGCTSDGLGDPTPTNNAGGLLG